MRYITVSVERDERTKISTDIPAWELPVLQTIHGREKVEVVGEKTVNKNYPDPQSEYERLEQRYKDHAGSGSSWVSLVYGQDVVGVDKLAKLIQDEIDSEEEAALMAEAANGEQADFSDEEAAPAPVVKAPAPAVKAKTAPKKVAAKPAKPAPIVPSEATPIGDE